MAFIEEDFNDVFSCLVALIPIAFRAVLVAHFVVVLKVCYSCNSERYIYIYRERYIETDI